MCLALLSDIEIPSGARIRETGNDLAQVMHAAQQDTRLIPGARDRVAVHFAIASQSLEQPDERVMPPGHHIGEHQSTFVRQRKSRLEPFRSILPRLGPSGKPSYSHVVTVSGSGKI